MSTNNFNSVFNKSNLEDAVKKTKVVAKDINKKSADLLEISKKKVELMDAKTKLSKSYEKYGTLQFDALLGNEIDENELDSTIAEITAYRERIDVLNGEIDGAKADNEDLRKNAAELKSSLHNASKDAIDVLTERSKAAIGAIKVAIENANTKKTGEEVDVEPVIIDDSSKDGVSAEEADTQETAEAENADGAEVQEAQAEAEAETEAEAEAETEAEAEVEAEAEAEVKADTEAE